MTVIIKYYMTITDYAIFSTLEIQIADHLARTRQKERQGKE